MITGKPIPFRVDVPQAKLDCVIERVRSYEWFPTPRGGAEYGVSPEFLKRQTADSPERE